MEALSHPSSPPNMPNLKEKRTKIKVWANKE